VRHLFNGFALALLAASGQALPVKAATDRPPNNVLFILADDLGVDMVDAYDPGGNPARMPVIGQLARDGVLFRNAWATPTCSPTRATILTGRYGFRTGIGLYINPHSTAELPQSELIIPEVLDLFPDLGYRHAVLGKWHLSNSIDAATRAGFGQFTGSRANFHDEASYDNWLKVECGKETWSTTYATTDTINEALEFIATTPEPWFLYLPLNAPHARFSNPPEHLHNQNLDWRSAHCERPNVYRAMVEAIDTEVGRLLKGMGSRRERTTVIFMGDNGTPNEVLPAPAPQKHGKLSPFEGGLHVPLIISGPMVRDAGRDVHALVSSTDLFATCLDLAGVRVPEDLPAGSITDSLSLVPYLVEPDAPAQRGMLFAEMFRPNLARELDFEIRAVRNERYKLIHWIKPQDHWGFYDLLLDPHETTDLMPTTWDLELWNQFENLCSKIDEVLGS
jgi:arylsulfatase B